MKTKSLKASALIPMLAIVVLGASPVYAHHSARAYDMTKSITLDATIKEFRWGAPHSAIIFAYKDSKGKAASMMLGGGDPGRFKKQGLQPADFHTGDKVKVIYHPNANGLPGGVLAKLTLPDGRFYVDTEFEAERGGKPAGGR